MLIKKEALFWLLLAAAVAVATALPNSLQDYMEVIRIKEVTLGGSGRGSSCDKMISVKIIFDGDIFRFWSIFITDINLPVPSFFSSLGFFNNRLASYLLCVSGGGGR